MLMSVYSGWMKDRYFGVTILGIIIRDTIKYAMLIVYYKHIYIKMKIFVYLKSVYLFSFQLLLSMFYCFIVD